MKPVLRRRWLVLLVVVTIVVWLPALGVVASSVMADLLGCALDEGSAHACLLRGVDIGPWLYAGFVMGWFMLFTGPLMLATLFIWGGVLLKWLIRVLRRQREP